MQTSSHLSVTGKASEQAAMDVMDPAPYMPAGRPSTRNIGTEVQVKVTVLLKAQREQANLQPSSFTHGSKTFRLGKIGGTLARAVRVDGRGKASSRGSRKPLTNQITFETVREVKFGAHVFFRYNLPSWHLEWWIKLS